MTRDELRAIQRVTCPACDSAPGQDCRDRRTRQHVTFRPHPLRVDAWRDLRRRLVAETDTVLAGSLQMTDTEFTRMIAYAIGQFGHGSVAVTDVLLTARSDSYEFTVDDRASGKLARVTIKLLSKEDQP